MWTAPAWLVKPGLSVDTIRHTLTTKVMAAVGNTSTRAIAPRSLQCPVSGLSVLFYSLLYSTVPDSTIHTAEQSRLHYLHVRGSPLWASSLSMSSKGNPILRQCLVLLLAYADAAAAGNRSLPVATNAPCARLRRRQMLHLILFSRSGCCKSMDLGWLYSSRCLQLL